LAVRVAGIERFGGPVQILEVAEPRALSHGEALVEVRAAGVGNWDDIVRAGDWDVGRTPPMALGVEAAGVLVDVGPGAERWSVGDNVLTHPLPLADQGTWAPWLIARAELLTRKPAGVSWAVAGAFPVPALTAVQVLDDALRVQAGETLLVNGGSGTTGGLIVSLAVLRGARVLATAGPSSHDRLARAGALTVVDYHNRDWTEQIVEATGGRGVDAAANAARGGAGSTLRAVRDGGRLATITSDPPAAERGVVINSVYVRPDAAQLELAVQAFAEDRLEFTLGASFTVEEAARALERAIAGGGGAVVLGW
jgi:NADPH:quinone reductase-like Zn-dependent oxidoreductase